LIWFPHLTQAARHELGREKKIEQERRRDGTGISIPQKHAGPHGDKPDVRVADTGAWVLRPNPTRPTGHRYVRASPARSPTHLHRQAGSACGATGLTESSFEFLPWLSFAAESVFKNI